MIKKANHTIGIVFPPSKGGGVVQYALGTAAALLRYVDKFNYCLMYYDVENPASFLQLGQSSAKFLPIQQKPVSLPRKILHFAGLTFNLKPFLVKNSYDVFQNKIDLLILPTPFTFELPLDIPYIVSIPDLMYKYYPDLPDYKFSVRYRRDIVYKSFARNSVFNVVDSEQGVEDLVKFFKIKKEKIRIIPFVPPEYIYRYKDMDLRTSDKILKKYSLPEKFLFYPAAFWVHKNHLRLVEALNLVKNKYNLNVHLVLVGSSSERTTKTYQEIMKLVHKLDLKDQITHLGFVSDQEIVALYKKAVALVFPTLIGPTSIPPLEAMILGTPVLYSNLFEMPKQVGDAGLLFNPFDVQDLAEKIYQIWIDQGLREQLVTKGYGKTQKLTLENYAKLWEKVIEEALGV